MATFQQDYDAIQREYKEKFQPVAPKIAKIRDMSEFGKGWRAGLDQTQAFGGGALALGMEGLQKVLPKSWGESGPVEGLRQWGVDTYQENMDEAAQYAPKVAKIEDLGTDKTEGDFGDWAAYNFANVAANVLPTLALGGAVGVVAKAGIKEAVKRRAKGMVSDRIKKQVATGARAPGRETAGLLEKAGRMEREAQRQIAKRANKGRVAGALAGSFGMEGGMSYGQLEQEVGGEKALLPAMTVGAINSALEVAPWGIAAKYLGLGQVAKKGIREAIKNDKFLRQKAKNILAGVGTGMTAEGITEAMQELVQLGGERWAKEEPMLAKLSDEDMSQILNAAAAGGLFGGVVGGVAGPAKGAMLQQQVQAAEDGLRTEREKAQEAALAMGQDEQAAGEQVVQAAADSADPVLAEAARRAQEAENSVLTNVPATNVNTAPEQPVVAEPAEVSPEELTARLGQLSQAQAERRRVLLDEEALAAYADERGMAVEQAKAALETEIQEGMGLYDVYKAALDGAPAVQPAEPTTPTEEITIEGGAVARPEPAPTEEVTIDQLPSEREVLTDRVTLEETPVEAQLRAQWNADPDFRARTLAKIFGQDALGPDNAITAMEGMTWEELETQNDGGLRDRLIKEGQSLLEPEPVEGKIGVTELQPKEVRLGDTTVTIIERPVPEVEAQAQELERKTSRQVREELQRTRQNAGAAPIWNEMGAEQRAELIGPTQNKRILEAEFDQLPVRVQKQVNKGLKDEIEARKPEKDPTAFPRYLESRVATRTGEEANVLEGGTISRMTGVLNRANALARQRGQVSEGVRILRDPRDGTVYTWDANENLLHKDVARQMGIDTDKVNIVPYSGQAVTAEQIQEVLLEMPGPQRLESRAAQGDIPAFHDLKRSQIRLIATETTRGAYMTRMSPEAFLRLTHPDLTEIRKDPFGTSNIPPYDQTQQTFDPAEVDQDGLFAIPYLTVDDQGNVKAHEGRHRAAALERDGASSIAVAIRPALSSEWGAASWAKPEDRLPPNMLRPQEHGNGEISIGPAQQLPPGVLLGRESEQAAYDRALEFVGSASEDRAVTPVRTEQEAQIEKDKRIEDIFDLLGLQRLESRVWHAGPNQWLPEEGYPYGRPRLDKVGTGEGGQLFGWGWYSAENEQVSGPEGSYAKSFAGQNEQTYAYQGRTVRGNMYDVTLSPEDTAVLWVGKLKGKQEAIDNLNRAINNLQANPEYTEAKELLSAAPVQEAAEWDGLAPNIQKMLLDSQAKKLQRANDIVADYQSRVEYNEQILNEARKINEKEVKAQPSEAFVAHLEIPDADIERMIQWEKPLSEQMDKVKAALTKLIEYDAAEEVAYFKPLSQSARDITQNSYGVGETKESAIDNLLRGMTGQQFYAELKDALPDPQAQARQRAAKQLSAATTTRDIAAAEAALTAIESEHPKKKVSEYLRSIGIVGNKYLDYGSRAKGEGTYNYVVWDQNVLNRVAHLNPETGKALSGQAQVEQALATYKGTLHQAAGVRPGGAEPLSQFMNDTARVFKDDTVQRAIDAGVLVVNETSPPDAPSGLFDRETGVMTVNLDKVGEGETGLSVLLHEGRHAGLANVLGDSLPAFHNDLLGLADRGNKDVQNSITRSTAAVADSLGIPHELHDLTLSPEDLKTEVKQTRELIEQQNPDLLIEEDLAYYIQAAANNPDIQHPGLWNRILTALKAWWAQSELGQRLAQVGIRVEMTPELAVELAKASVRAAVNTSQTGMDGVFAATPRADAQLQSLPSRAQIKRWWATDASDPLQEHELGVGQQIKAHIIDNLATIAPKSKVMHQVAELAKSKTSAAQATINRLFLHPIVDLAKKTGLTQKELDDYLTARSVLLDDENWQNTQKRAHQMGIDLEKHMPNKLRTKMAARRAALTDEKGSVWIDSSGTAHNINPDAVPDKMIELVDEYMLEMQTLANAGQVQPKHQGWEKYRDEWKKVKAHSAGMYSPGKVDKDGNLINPTKLRDNPDNVSDEMNAYKIFHDDKYKGVPGLPELVSKWDEMTQYQLKLLVDGGKITQAEADAMRTAHPHYVKLRRASADNDKSFEFLRGQQTGGGRPKVRAGSVEFDPPVHVMQNTIEQAHRNAAAAQQNLAARHLYDLVAGSPKDWEKWYTTVPKKVHNLDKFGFVHDFVTQQHDNFSVPVTVMSPGGKKGKTHYIRAKDQNQRAKLFAAGMNGLGAPQQGAISKILGLTNNLVRATAVSFSPAFLAANIFRDPATALMNLQATEGKDFTKEFLYGFKGSKRSGLKNAYRILSDVYFGDRANADPANVAAVDMWENAGGKQSFVQSLKEMDDGWKSFDGLLRREHKPVWREFRKGLEFVERMNILVESVSRFSAFQTTMEAWEKGKIPKWKTREDALREAAIISKEITTNFDRKGFTSSAINLWHLFFNATVSGNAQVIMNLSRSPKLVKLVGATVVAGALFDMLGRELADDDDEGRNEWDNIPDYVKERNIILPVKVGGQYVKIPAPWVYNTVWRTGGLIGELAAGKRDMVSVPVEIGANMMNTFNPLGNTSWLQSLSPTALDPVVQAVENKNFAGNPLHPTAFPGAGQLPESQLHWEGTPDAYKHLAKTLNSWTGGDVGHSGLLDHSAGVYQNTVNFFLAGVGKALGQMYNMTGPAWEDKEFNMRNVPILSTFMHSPRAQVDTQLYHDRVGQVLSAVKTVDMYTTGEHKDPAKRREARQTYVKELRMEGMVKDAERQLKSLRKRMKLAKERGNDERARDLKEQMTAVKQRFNERYERRVG